MTSDDLQTAFAVLLSPSINSLYEKQKLRHSAERLLLYFTKKRKNMIWVWSNLRVCRWFLGEVTILLTYMNYSWCLMVISEGYAVFPLCQRYIHNQNMMFSCYNEQAVMRRCHPHCNVCCVSYMPNFIRLLLVSV